MKFKTNLIKLDEIQEKFDQITLNSTQFGSDYRQINRNFIKLYKIRANLDQITCKSKQIVRHSTLNSM